MSNKRKVYYRGMVDGVHRARHDVSLLLPQLIREVRNPTDDLDDHELVDDFVSSLDLLVWKIEEECRIELALQREEQIWEGRND